MGREFSAAWSWSARTARFFSPRAVHPERTRFWRHSRPSLDLKGKVVLVTGAARRVGLAIAEGLAQDGARLAVHYHTAGPDADDAVRASGGEGFPADLRDPRAAGELPRQVLARMGRLDVVVNSAAVMIRQPFGEITAEGWEQVLNLNLRAAFFVSQSAAPALRKARGRIVNISDV